MFPTIGNVKEPSGKTSFPEDSDIHCPQFIFRAYRLGCCAYCPQDVLFERVYYRDRCFLFSSCFLANPFLLMHGFLIKNLTRFQSLGLSVPAYISQPSPLWYPVIILSMGLSALPTSRI
jgi:hypothetical protein